MAAAKAKPNSISLGTPGNGSTPHLAMELFAHTAGIQLRHVPYKGGSQALTDTIGGHTEIVAVNALEAAPLAKAGKLRVLAVMSPERSGVLPNVPTVAETVVPGYEVYEWNGVFVPSSTPADVSAKLQKAVAESLQEEDVRKRFTDLGAQPVGSTPAQFVEYLKNEDAKWGDVVRKGNIKLD